MSFASSLDYDYTKEPLYVSQSNHLWHLAHIKVELILIECIEHTEKKGGEKNLYFVKKKTSAHRPSARQKRPKKRIENKHLVFSVSLFFCLYVFYQFFSSLMDI